jgi:flagellar protein FliO/FliZ
MKLKRLYRIVPAVLLAFSLVAVAAAPALLSKPKRHAAKQETVKQSKKEEAAEEQESGVQPAVEDKKAEAGEGVKGADADKDSTVGVPTTDYKEEDFKPQVEEESAVWMFIKMLLVLGIFAGGFYYFYRFVTKKAGVNIFGSDAVRVLSVVPLGQNKFLQVVDLAGKVLVVGVSDSAVSLITEITEKDQIDRIRILSTRTPPPQGGAGGFQDQVMGEIGKIIGRVKEFRRRDRGSRVEVVDNPADIEYLRRQRDRLKDMDGPGHE